MWRVQGLYALSIFSFIEEVGRAVCMLYKLVFLDIFQMES